MFYISTIRVVKMTISDRICCQDATPGVVPFCPAMLHSLPCPSLIITAFQELAAFTKGHRESVQKCIHLPKNRHYVVHYCDHASPERPPRRGVLHASCKFINQTRLTGIHENAALDYFGTNSGAAKGLPASFNIYFPDLVLH